MGAIAVVVFALIALDSAGMPDSASAEFSPHVLSTGGRTVVKRAEGTVTISEGKTADIREGDQIKTLPASSATVFWADGSVTRLSEKTTIDVTELSANRDAGTSRIDFSVSEGKTWSRVYQYLTDDSYFKQRFDGGTKVAAVRGTAFEINTEKGYLRTESHAVDVTDPAGKLLATVPEGIAVRVTDLTALLASALDSAWKDLNLVEDAKFSAEYAKRARADIARRISGGSGSVASLRQLVLGKDVPVSVSFSGNSLVVDVPEDFGSKVRDGRKTYETLLRAYQVTAALPEDVATIRSKEQLRDAIMKVAPESEKAKLATLFARHEVYDSWTDVAAANDAELLRMRKKIREYVAAGADEGVLKNLESALPKAKIDLFNAKMDEWKKRGFEGLSDPGLFITPPKAVLDAADDVRSIVNDAKTLFPSLGK